MRKLIGINTIVLLALIAAGAVGAQAANRLVLTRGILTALPVSTHRPEIRTTSDKRLVIAVVQPDRGPSREGR